jgi:hypothetical protein
MRSKISIVDRDGNPLSSTIKSVSGPGGDRLRQWLGENDVLFAGVLTARRQ